MTKKLLEIFDIADETDLPDDELVPDVEEIVELAEQDSNVMISAITNSEKINAALPSVLDIDMHDIEMDDIANKALSTFDELHALGLQVSDAHTGKVFEVAATMLKTALDARDAKVNRKLKQVELLIKKQKLDYDMGDIQTAVGEDFDRNDLIKMFMDANDPKPTK